MDSPQDTVVRSWGGWFRLGLIRLLGRYGFREETFLILVACLIGVLTGVGSVGFTKLIEYTHDLCYGGDSLAGIYGGRALFLVLLPALGALFVGLITFFFAREAKGHGVPEVMDAIARRDGVIRPRVAIAKEISSALTIGSGGSAGTEGPIIQIGSAIGSSSGQFFQVSRHNLPVLVGAGAAAGISAIFHAPIAGVLFALEIFLRDVSFRTFSPVLIASVLSSVVVSALLGTNQAIFPLLHPETAYPFRWFELGNYVLLGLLCALAAVGFVRLLYRTEDLFDGLKVHPIAKPVIGAMGLGLLGVASAILLHEFQRDVFPGIFGNGYPLIGRCIDALSQQGVDHPFPLTVAILLFLLFAKALATSLTLGSGGSGGVFAPSLFLGATLGYACGLALQHIPLFADITPATYALVGMASVVAATTHAPLTAIVIVFELTRNYRIVLPLMFAATIALAIAQFLSRDSIYTLKLRRRGIQYETRAKTAILRRLYAEMVLQPAVTVLRCDVPVKEVIGKATETEGRDFILIDPTGQYYGVLYGSDLQTALLQPDALSLLVASDLARTDVPCIRPTDTLDVLLDLFSRLDVNSLPVRNEAREYAGIVTRAALMRRYQQELLGES